MPPPAQTLTATIATPSTDPDGDQVTYSYAWYKDGVLQPALITNTVPASATIEGQVWKCVVTPSDGSVNGPSGEDQVTVGNSAPSAPTVTLVPASPLASDYLVAIVTGPAIDADGDAITYTFQWYRDTGSGFVLQPDVTSANVTFAVLPASATAGGDAWKVVVTPSDGKVSGPSGQDQVTVGGGNSPPTAPVVDVLPNWPLASDDLVAAITIPSTDPDGDTVTYAYAWYKDGVLQPEFITNTVPSSNTSVGEVWKVVVTPNDGTVGGPSGQDQVTVTAPQVIRYALHAGWNMIGLPLTGPVSWENVMIAYDGETVDMVTASDENTWVSKYIFWYDPEVGGYKMQTAPEGMLYPWRGYWVKAFVPAELVITS